jgi:hypothetical protein
MKASISACKAPHWRVKAFEAAIRGPGLRYFESRSYGKAVGMLSIILETQNPAKTLRHHTRYFPKDRWFYCHFILEDQAVEVDPDAAAFQAMASTIVEALTKSLRKIKKEDFDATSFVLDLAAYFDEVFAPDRTI